VRALAPGERVALDIDSLAEWGDEPEHVEVDLTADETVDADEYEDADERV